MMLNIKLAIYGLVLVGMVGYMVKQKMTINTLEQTIANNSEYIDKLNKTIVEKDIKLYACINNNIELNNKIREVNIKFNHMKVEHNRTLAEFNKWKNKPDDTKYTKKIHDVINSNRSDLTVCEQGLELNRRIAELNYNDL